MNTLSIPSVKDMFRSGVKTEIAPDDSGVRATAQEATSNLGDIVIRRIIPNMVGKNLESKVLVCETENNEIAILVLQSQLNTPHVTEIERRVLNTAARNKVVKKYPVSSMELLSISKMQSGDFEVERKSSNSYENAVESIVDFAVENNASDITFDVVTAAEQSQVSFKIEGRQIKPEIWKLPTVRAKEILNVLWQDVMGGSESAFNAEVESQGIYEIRVGQRLFKLRFQSIAADNGPSVTLRVLEQNAVQPLEDYGYLQSHLKLLKRHKESSNGFIIFAGRVGSGKTTAISALIDTLPTYYKIFMLEDPVEIVLENAIQCTVERPLDGSGNKAYSSKLMAMKRNAPDAISIGEVRDELNGRAIIEIGGMGSLGFCTVHASGQLHIPERLWQNSIKVPSDFLASPGMLKLLAYQALVPKLCSCAKPLASLKASGGLDLDGEYQDSDYWASYIAMIEESFDLDSSSMNVRNHEGCEKCRRKHFSDLDGYIGRQPIVEMFEPSKHYEFLRLTAARDTLGIYEYFNSLPRSKMSDPDMTNKNIVECGLYLALQGQLDPRDIERATEPFENVIRQPRYTSARNDQTV